MKTREWWTPTIEVFLFVSLLNFYAKKKKKKPISSFPQCMAMQGAKCYSGLFSYYINRQRKQLINQCKSPERWSIIKIWRCSWLVFPQSSNSKLWQKVSFLCFLEKKKGKWVRSYSFLFFCSLTKAELETACSSWLLRPAQRSQRQT